MATGKMDQQNLMTKLEDYQDTEDNDTGMSLVDHLEELRWRIFKSLIAIAVGAIVAFIFRGQIIGFLEKPLPKEVHKLVFTGIGEGFTVSLMVSIAAGFIIALPVILYQAWAFISPGLYEKEKKYAVPFILIGIVLFVSGISLGYFVLHYPVEWLINFASDNFQAFVTAGSYFSFVAFFLIAFGVVFELPLVLTFLAQVDIIGSETLAKRRAGSHIGMWVAAAILMPGADPYSPIILGVAMSFLYELTILFIKFLKK